MTPESYEYWVLPSYRPRKMYEIVEKRIMFQSLSGNLMLDFVIAQVMKPTRTSYWL